MQPIIFIAAAGAWIDNPNGKSWCAFTDSAATEMIGVWRREGVGLVIYDLARGKTHRLSNWGGGAYQPPLFDRERSTRP